MTGKLTDGQELLLAELAAEAEDAAARTQASEDAPPDSRGALEKLRELAEETQTLDEAIERGESLVSALKIRRNNIAYGDMPRIMDDARIEDFSHNGQTFEVKTDVHASIPEDKREDAFAWLVENKHDAIILSAVVAEFPKGFDDEAKKLEAYIVQNFQMATVSRNRRVLWQTLTKWLKEYLALRKEDPLLPPPPVETLGARIGRVVKVKNKRKKD